MIIQKIKKLKNEIQENKNKFDELRAMNVPAHSKEIADLVTKITKLQGKMLKLTIKHKKEILEELDKDSSLEI